MDKKKAERRLIAALQRTLDFQRQIFEESANDSGFDPKIRASWVEELQALEWVIDQLNGGGLKPLREMWVPLECL